MNKYVEAALESYETIKKELKTFTRANTDFELDIDDGGYPLVFTFSPSEDAAQESMFEPDENGAIGSLRVICSSAGAGVDLGLKCHIQAEVLKKAAIALSGLRRGEPACIQGLEVRGG